MNVLSLRITRPAAARFAEHLLLSVLVGGAVVALSGCVALSMHKRPVAKTVQAENVRDATLEQLNSQLAAQYAGIKTLNARVEIKVATGGQREGQVTEVIPTFSGFILLRKPSDLHVILQLPVLGSVALETVSDGKTFKLSVPKKNIAREGTEDVVNPSAKGFENLRPKVIRDALLVPAVARDEFVSKTNNDRMIPAPKGTKEGIQEPDYDLTVTRRKSGNELQTIRVIHISRVTLKPYQQDIYDEAGNLIETVTYDQYEKSGDVDYPRSIAISMPIYEYSLKIEITKLSLNEDMDDEQFVLKFPEGMKVTKM